MVPLFRTLVLSSAIVFGAAAESAPAPAGVAGLAREIREAGLDEAACYHVRDLGFAKEDLRFYLTDGYLIFGKPVRGHVFSAIFIPPETGDAEVIVMPPTRSERASLAKFADTPNLNEHFTTAVFIFSDDTAKTLLTEIQTAGGKPDTEKGVLIAQEWGPVVRNLTGSVDMRLVQDHLTRGSGEWALFYATLRGREHGNVDFIYDPQAREQITVGKIEHRDDRSYFDVWTSFPARSFRTGRRQPFRTPISLSDFRITAELDTELRLKAVTRMRLQTSAPVTGTVPFDLTRQMTATRVLLDGRELEIFAHESLRTDLLRGSDNGVILVGLDVPLEPGRTYEVEIHHDGSVVTAAGNNVYFVSARTNWYPSHGTNFALYDMTFRYPKALHLVSNGDMVEEKTEGEWRTTRSRTSAPIRFAGFNLGEYARVSTERAGFVVEVNANRKVEAALRALSTDMVVVPSPVWPRAARRPDVLAVPAPTTPPNPTARLQDLAADFTAAMEFFASFLGPPPLKKLTVSPIPGTFGQGFPGLLYLSTLAYLDPRERPPAFRREMQQLFYSEILEAHEAAHQWWGNIVTSSSYEDDWVMEALANYSALMFLEKRKGRRAVDEVLAEYKGHLLANMPQGGTIESAGPITWGTRLRSSQFPPAWRVITYEKGSWIMHMLRGQMGDDTFQKMLGTLVARYRFQPVTTEQFHKVAQEFMPARSGDRSLDSFFEQWVYGTGIPSVNLAHSVRGKAPALTVKATVTQSGVDDDFTAMVPVEVQFPGKRAVTQWVRTTGEPVTVTIPVKVQPVRIALDPNNVFLRK